LDESVTQRDVTQRDVTQRDATQTKSRRHGNNRRDGAKKIVGDDNADDGRCSAANTDDERDNGSSKRSNGPEIVIKVSRFQKNRSTLK
jgi:hypothetical protein